MIIRENKQFRGNGMVRKNRRSLHYAPPDFLLRSVALINCMRLSLRRAANVVVAGSAKKEIRVGSGRDDNSALAARASVRNTCTPIELSSRPERSAVEGPAV